MQVAALDRFSTAVGFEEKVSVIESEQRIRLQRLIRMELAPVDRGRERQRLITEDVPLVSKPQAVHLGQDLE